MSPLDAFAMKACFARASNIGTTGEVVGAVEERRRRVRALGGLRAELLICSVEDPQETIAVSIR